MGCVRFVVELLCCVDGVVVFEFVDVGYVDGCGVGVDVV